MVLLSSSSPHPPKKKGEISDSAKEEENHTCICRLERSIKGEAIQPNYEHF